jgi:hypothetical protein
LGIKGGDKVSTLVIYDARSWVAAKANMLNGKGTENEKYYKNAEIVFLDIENIHKVRESYKYDYFNYRKIKKACLEPDNINWF